MGLLALSFVGWCAAPALPEQQLTGKAIILLLVH